MAARFRLGRRILVIGDVHVRSDENHDQLDRLYALSKLIYDERPDAIVVIGDLADFTSLDGWKGSTLSGGSGGKSIEGHRIKADLAAFDTALAAIMSETRKMNRKHERSRRRDRLYRPELHFLTGNHEDRLDRAAEAHPALTGFVGTHIIREACEKQGWNFHRFLAPVEIGGVFFSHYFTTGVSTRPAGVNQVLTKTMRSVVFGHTHSFGFDQRPVLGGGTVSAVCVGCYKPHDRAGPHDWLGVCFLNNVRDGSFSVSQVEQDYILEAYGDGDRAKLLRGARAQAARELDEARGAFA